MHKDQIIHLLVQYNNLTSEVENFQRLDSVSTDLLIDHFEVDRNIDPELLKPVSIVPEDMPFLAQHVDVTLEIDFEHYSYTIEAVEDDLT